MTNVVTISTSCPVAAVAVVVVGAGRGELGLGRGGALGLRCGGSSVEFAVAADVADVEPLSCGQSKTGWPRTLPPTP